MDWSFFRKIFGLIDFHEEETVERDDQFIAKNTLDVGAGSSTAANELTATEQKPRMLPSLEQVQSHVRRWTDDTFNEGYADSMLTNLGGWIACKPRKFEGFSY